MRVTRTFWQPDRDPDKLFWIQTHPVLASRRRVYRLYHDAVGQAPAKPLSVGVPLPNVAVSYAS